MMAGISPKILMYKIKSNKISRLVGDNLPFQWATEVSLPEQLGPTIAMG